MKDPKKRDVKERASKESKRSTSAKRSERKEEVDLPPFSASPTRIETQLHRNNRNANCTFILCLFPLVRPIYHRPSSTLPPPLLTVQPSSFLRLVRRVLFLSKQRQPRKDLLPVLHVLVSKEPDEEALFLCETKTKYERKERETNASACSFRHCTNG